MTTKRRPKGSGSIKKLPNGKYKVIVTIPCSITGKQTRTSRTVNTEREAISMQASLTTGIDTGTVVAITKDTFETFTRNVWLKAKAKTVRETTYRVLEQRLSAHLMPYFGKMKMQKITTATINSFVDKMIEEAHLRTTTINQYCGTLSGIFEYAMRTGIVPKNPVKWVDKVSRESEEVHVYSQEEIKRLLESAKEHSDLMYCFCLLASTSGARLGELLALTWSDIDTKKISITKTLIYGSDKKLRTGSPKTTGSRRKVSVDPKVLKVLKDTLKVKGSTQVFAGPDGSFLHPATLGSRFAKIAKDAGIAKARVHAFRHTHATQLISDGYDLKTVSKRLGHANPMLTIRLYAHWVPERDEDAAMAISSWVLM